MTLSGHDQRTALLALTIAIGHETTVLQRLQADEDFRSFKETVALRRQQIETFQRLLDKLRRAAKA